MISGSRLLHMLGPLVAWAVKWFYNRAGAEQLSWILGPTCWLVEQLTGVAFERERYTGWTSHGARMIVGPSCAGVNFLVIAFVTLFHSFVDRWSGWRAKCRWVLVSAGAAYGLAVSTNALRISAAIELRAEGGARAWITPERAHLLLGTAIYLLSLWLAHRAFDRLVTRVAPPSHDGRGRFASLVPFAWYAVIALGVPLAGGAWHLAQFRDHAALVLPVVLAAAAAALLARSCRTSV